MAKRPGSTLIFAAGTYANLTGPVLELGPAHSGSGAKHPTTFAAASGATVTLSGGFTIPPAAIHLYKRDANGPAGCTAPPASSASRVWTVDLLSLPAAPGQDPPFSDVSAFGTIGGVNQPESMAQLFVADEPMLLARYPDVNASDRRLWQWLRAEGGFNDTLMYKGADAAKVEEWQTAPDPHVHTFTHYEWSDSILNVSSIDTSNRSIRLSSPPGAKWCSACCDPRQDSLPARGRCVPHHPTWADGYGWAPNGSRWLGFNLPCELTDAGEWYLDRHTHPGRLYFIPPDDSFHPTTHPLTLSFAESVVTAHGAHDLRFEGLRIAHSRGAAMKATAVSRMTVDNCSVGRAGAHGLLLDTRDGPLEPVDVSRDGLTCDAEVSGQQQRFATCVTRSEFTAIGGPATAIMGGDVASLRRADLLCAGNKVADYSRWGRTCKIDDPTQSRT